MKRAELEAHFRTYRDRAFEARDPEEALVLLGERLPVVLFRRERIAGYVGRGENTFCEEGTFFSGEGFSELGETVYREGLSGAKEAAEDEMDRAILFALSTLLERYYKRASLLALKADNEVERQQIQDIAENCRHLASSAPENFAQSLQLIWAMQLGEVLMDTGKVFEKPTIEGVLLEMKEKEELGTDAPLLLSHFFDKVRMTF